jgi:DNA-binding XRE family transcriptional regulator
MSCGDMLRTLRGDKSQSCIANDIGITKSSWAMYERNERVPRDEIKIKIANYFGRTVQEIFFGG